MKFEKTSKQAAASLRERALTKPETASKRKAKSLMSELEMRATYKRSDFSTLVRGKFYAEALAACASPRKFSKIKS